MRFLNAKRAGIAALSLVSAAALAFGAAGCSGDSEADGENEDTYVVSIDLSASDEDGTVYTVTYSDGTTSQLVMPAGEGGKDGQDGQDGEDLTVKGIWQEYVAETGSDITLAEFIEQYLSLSVDHSAAASASLLSCVSVYAEFVETQSMGGGFFPGMGGMSSSQVVQGGGSGVIFEIDDDSVYIVTNYHVAYYADADEDLNGGSKIGRYICCYLYGSEYMPEITDMDDDGMYVYEYGDSAIECEYIGGSMEADIAVLRADKEDVFAVNPDVRAAEFADGYNVGQAVYAIGNAESYGISLTEGVISVDNEYIYLDIDEDGTDDSYRSIRFDATIYHGNSGGGLFNSEGELVGITNAGVDGYESICYAIPCSIAEGVIGNIMYHYRDGDDSTNGVYKPSLGITVSGDNARYVLDGEGGGIVEEIYVESVSRGSAAESMGITAGDRLISVTVNGREYVLSRTFDIGDLLYMLRPGDVVYMTYERDGAEADSLSYTLEKAQFVSAV